jgi:protein farnesyltransferase subunit beta
MTIVRTPDAQLKDNPLKQTESSRAQFEAQLECEPFFVDLPTLPPSQIEHLRDTGLLGDDKLEICLLKDKHITYLSQIWLQDLRSSFVTLDSSRPWILYWCLHGCDLLDHTPSTAICQGIVETLESCWTPATVRLPRKLVTQDPILSTAINDSDDEIVELEGGGFGGGPGQMPHAATNYAAVLALCILAGSGNCPAACTLLEQKRQCLYTWLLSLKQTDTGSFRMQHDGEIDVRATYCVMAVAKLLHICTDTLTVDAMKYVSACQTYEGGFGGEPFTEAHGGYTFCATAAVQLLAGWSQVNAAALTGWLARRQMGFEGGFNGRANKLVDGCYSFWQGGALAIVSRLHDATKTREGSDDPWLSDQSNRSTTTSTTATNDDLTLLFDDGMLQRYILLCAQDVHGGLRDKPSANRDFYHSCYNLSGLSVAQHYASRNENEPPTFGHAQQSRVAQTHPCYNIRIDHARQALDHFTALGWPQK